MSNLGAFASLLQLGFGIGIGLSVFRTPLTLRAINLGKRLDAELSIVRNNSSDTAENLRGRLSSAKLMYHDKMCEIEKSYVPLMGAVLAGAAINLFYLVWSSVSPEIEIDNIFASFLIFISVFYYAIIALFIEIYTRVRMKPIYSSLSGII